MRRMSFSLIALLGACLPLTTRAWTLTAVGDIMLDRHVRTLIGRYGQSYPFSQIQSQLTGDRVVANLEGPFTNSRSRATDTSLIFTFDPTLAPTLKSSGFTTLSLANNHTLNYGLAGLTSTRATLHSAGLDYFGDPSNRRNAYVTNLIGRQRVTWLGYHGLVAGLPAIVTDVRNAHAKGEYVIVMAHSGTEYNLKFTSRQQSEYHQLVDAGADLVIAAHPHVIEALEIYKSKLIAYSLGNFVFDQYFSTETQLGLMLKFTFNLQPKTCNLSLIPLDLTKSQPKVATGLLRQRVLNRLAQTSVVSAAQRDMIRTGQLSF